MQVLDVPVLGKQIRQIFLRRFFVDVGRDHDPSFDTADRDRVRRGAGFAADV